MGRRRRSLIGGSRPPSVDPAPERVVSQSAEPALPTQPVQPQGPVPDGPAPTDEFGESMGAFSVGSMAASDALSALPPAPGEVDNRAEDALQEATDDEGNPKTIEQIIAETVAGSSQLGLPLTPPPLPRRAVAPSKAASSSQQNSDADEVQSPPQEEPTTSEPSVAATDEASAQTLPQAAPPPPVAPPPAPVEDPLDAPSTESVGSDPFQVVDSEAERAMAEAPTEEIRRAGEDTTVDEEDDGVDALEEELARDFDALAKADTSPIPTAVPLASERSVPQRLDDSVSALYRSADPGSPSSRLWFITLVCVLLLLALASGVVVWMIG